MGQVMGGPVLPFSRFSRSRWAAGGRKQPEGRGPGRILSRDRMDHPGRLGHQLNRRSLIGRHAVTER